MVELILSGARTEGAVLDTNATMAEQEVTNVGVGMPVDPEEHSDPEWGKVVPIDV